MYSSVLEFFGKERRSGPWDYFKLDLEGALPRHPLSTALLRYPAGACQGRVFGAKNF